MVLIDFAAWMILAFVLIARSCTVRSVWETAALAFALALGFKSLLLYALIAFGVKPDRWLQLSLGIAVLYGGAAWFLLRFKSLRRTALRENQSRIVFICIAVLCVLVLLSLANALFFPVTGVDGIWYELRGRVLLHEVRFESDTLNAQLSQYPPLTPLLYAWLISFGVEPVKLLFPLLYLCLLTLFYFRLKAGSRSPRLAAAFTLVLGSTPYFWWHSTLPFLDLTTAFYYSTGALYGFSLLRKWQEGGVDSQDVADACLSGALFGLAAWNRPEFLLYNSISLAMIILALNKDLPSRRRLLWAFAVPLLALPTLWLCTLFTFDSPLERRIPALAMACGAQWLLVGAASCLTLRFGFKRLAGLAVAGSLLFVLFIVFFGPRSVSAGQAMWIAFSRTVSVHGFYSFSAWLALLLFVRQSAWPPLQRGLGGFLLLYLLVHFMLFSYSEPRWTGMDAFIEATFRSPGNSVNLSDTRGMMAWYPVFLFFISRLPVVRRAFDAD